MAPQNPQSEPFKSAQFGASVISGIDELAALFLTFRGRPRRFDGGGRVVEALERTCLGM